MKFKTKPTEIDAIQWLGNNLSELISFILDEVAGCDDADNWVSKDSDNGLHVYSLQGWVVAHVGDWIICPQNRNELYPCKPEVFLQKYTTV